MADHIVYRCVSLQGTSGYDADSVTGAQTVSSASTSISITGATTSSASRVIIAASSGAIDSDSFQGSSSWSCDEAGVTFEQFLWWCNSDTGVGGGCSIGGGFLSGTGSSGTWTSTWAGATKQANLSFAIYGSGPSTYDTTTGEGVDNVAVTEPIHGSGFWFLLFVQSANEEIETPPDWTLVGTAGEGTPGASGSTRITIFIAPADANPAMPTLTYATGNDEGAGAVSASMSVAGVGASTHAAAGAISASMSTSGVGASTAEAAGAVATSMSVSGVGAAAVAGAGAISTSVTVTGVGAATAEAAGSVSASMSMSGVGAATAEAAGAIAVTTTIDGISPDVGEGDGAIAVTMSLDGVGASSAAAAGAISTSMTLAGASSATTEAAGAVAVAMSVSGAAAATAAADGAVAVSMSVAGVGAAVVNAAGAIATSMTLAGAGTAVAQAAGAVSMTTSVAGTATAVAAAAGAISASMSVVGISGEEYPGLGDVSDEDLDATFREDVFVASLDDGVFTAALDEGGFTVAPGSHDLMALPTRRDIRRVSGDTYSFSCLIDLDGEDYDITGHEFSTSVYRDGTLQFEMTGSIVDAATGEVSFAPSEAQADQAEYLYSYLTRMTTPGGAVRTVMWGTWDIRWRP